MADYVPYTDVALDLTWNIGLETLIYIKDDQKLFYNDHTKSCKEQGFCTHKHIWFCRRNRLCDPLFSMG